MAPAQLNSEATTTSVLSPPSTSVNNVLKSALAGGQLSDASPVAMFMDTPRFDAECRSLVSAFPAGSLHGFAVKACPVVGVLRAAHEAGMGGECASEGEVALCLAAGMPASRIILDSPAKTDAVITSMLSKGVHINADNFDEVERIDALVRSTGHKPAGVGLRVNPQTGSGTISMTSTAGMANKFGVPLKECRAEIIAVFELYPFLTCVHVHVGSQGVSPQMLVDGTKAAVQLADEINLKAPGQVTSIDIGGGLSVDYGGDTTPTVVTFAQYVEMLRNQVPRLFEYRIMTEFGRRLAAPCGLIAAKVQAVKSSGGRKYVVCHAGADLLMRAVYAADKWRHDIDVHDAKGRLRKTTTNLVKVDVAGPLCFSGDIIAKDRMLPPASPGDVLVIHAAGAYTMGMYSRHTSQLVPAVYGYDGNAQLSVLKKAETLQDLVYFWGGEVSK